jgi:hypothetical protein
MKPVLSACEQCGLREVRHELEKKGVIIRFCDECYWGEITDPTEGATATQPPAAAPDQPTPKTA